jgi:hypothetical protein
VSRSSKELAIAELAIASDRAGFRIEQMIELLDAGLSVASLLDLIAWTLEHRTSGAICSSGWVV